MMNLHMRTAIHLMNRDGQARLHKVFAELREVAKRNARGVLIVRKAHRRHASGRDVYVAKVSLRSRSMTSVMNRRSRSMTSVMNLCSR